MQGSALGIERVGTSLEGLLAQFKARNGAVEQAMDTLAAEGILSRPAQAYGGQRTTGARQRSLSTPHQIDMVPSNAGGTQVVRPVAVKAGGEAGRSRRETEVGDDALNSVLASLDSFSGMQRGAPGLEADEFFDMGAGGNGSKSRRVRSKSQKVPGVADQTRRQMQYPDILSQSILDAPGASQRQGSGREGRERVTWAPAPSLGLPVPQDIADKPEIVSPVPQHSGGAAAAPSGLLSPPPSKSQHPFSPFKGEDTIEEGWRAMSPFQGHHM